MAFYSLRLPITEAEARMLRAGDTVELTGDMYTGRDAAHKRLIALLDEGKPLPVDLQGQTIYYVGPAPASPGHAVGSAGPTTSYRMDAYTPRSIKESRVVAYPDLGAEAIYQFTVEKFPAVVLMDSVGGNLYESGPQAYACFDKG